MPNCSVPFCSKRPGHCFPRDETIRKKWRIAIKRIDPKTKKLWMPGPGARVCYNHFLPSDYVETLEGEQKSLYKDAVPSVFSFNKKIASVSDTELALEKTKKRALAENQEIKTATDETEKVKSLCKDDSVISSDRITPPGDTDDHEEEKDKSCVEIPEMNTTSEPGVLRLTYKETQETVKHRDTNNKNENYVKNKKSTGDLLRRKGVWTFSKVTVFQNSSDKSKLYR